MPRELHQARVILAMLQLQPYERCVREAKTARSERKPGGSLLFPKSTLKWPVLTGADSKVGTKTSAIQGRSGKPTDVSKATNLLRNPYVPDRNEDDNCCCFRCC